MEFVMPKKPAKTQEQLANENEDLRTRLDEAEETLRAIRNGEVDALIVSGEGDEQVFTLKAAGELLAEANQSRLVLLSVIEDQKQTEAALRESEERYKGLIDSAFDGVVILRDRTIVSANRAYAEMFGYSVEEVIGQSVLKFTAPEYHDLAVNQIAQTESTYESVGLSNDGTRIPIEISGQVCMYDGQPASLAAVRNITERTRAEEIQTQRAARALFRADVSSALAASRAPLRATLELCATAMVQHLGAAFARVWTLNREGDVLELQTSAGMYTHIDGAHGRVPVGSYKIGKIAQERVPHITNDVQTDPRVSDKEWAQHEGMVAFAGYPLLLENRLLGVMAMFSRTELAEDTLDALASVADLMSQGIERKRAGELLEESERRFRQLADNINEAFWIVDPNRREMLYVSPAYEEIWGRTRAALYARPDSFYEALHPEDRPAILKAAEEQKRGERADSEYRILRPDGSIRWIRDRAFPIKGKDGAVSRIVGIAEDITERT